MQRMLWDGGAGCGLGVERKHRQISITEDLLSDTSGRHNGAVMAATAVFHSKDLMLDDNSHWCTFWLDSIHLLNIITMQTTEARRQQMVLHPPTTVLGLFIVQCHRATRKRRLNRKQVAKLCPRRNTDLWASLWSVHWKTKQISDTLKNRYRYDSPFSSYLTFKNTVTLK